MRITIIILAVAFAVMGGGLAYRYNQEALNAQKELNQERYNRMIAEENLQKADAKIKLLQSDIARSEDKLKSVENILDETKTVNSDLKARIDKATEIKQDLENKIKELEKLSGAVPGQAG